MQISRIEKKKKNPKNFSTHYVFSPSGLVKKISESYEMLYMKCDKLYIENLIAICVYTLTREFVYTNFDETVKVQEEES